MKKTTKILLVLAAVVAMTIGAVSTVMAADDYATISEWVAVDEAKNIWQAKDVNGDIIARGWAVSDAGRWYFFDSGKMLVNTFITYNQEIYYLDGTGAMASNAWIGFDADTDTPYDTKVNTVDKYIKNSYDKIIDIVGFNGAFDIVKDTNRNDIFVNPLVEDSKDEVLWCYFDENGIMAQNKWIEAYGIWYYIAGAYCVVGDYSVAIDGNKDGDWKDSVDGVYGFDKNGAMLVGWAYLDKSIAAVDGDKTDIDTPYEDQLDGTAKTENIWYTYYDEHGVQVNRVKDTDDVKEGWEKIGGKWCYFIEEPEIGMKLLQNTMLKDVDADDDGLLKNDAETGYFYLDADGYMVTGVKTFAKDFIVNMWDEEAHADGTHKFTENATFLFDTTLGKMLDGLQSGYYYNHATSELAANDKVVIVLDSDITTSGAITIDAATGTRVIAKYEGQRVAAKNFFVVTTDVNDLDGDDDKADKIVMYFEHGRLQKNQAISFGEVTIGINANGAVIEAITSSDGKVKVAGYTYVASTKDLTLTVGGVDYTLVGLKK